MNLLILSAFVIIFIAGTIASCKYIYFIVKPYFKTADSRKLLIGFILLFAFVGWGGAAVVWFLNRQPAYFQQGIDQLHTSKYIKAKIGGFNSYTFRPESIIKDPAKSTVFQVEINGDSLTLFLTCIMNKAHGKWRLVNIHEDSVHTVKP